ncbi:N-alpha-acetyltransferase 50 [Nowakowskiella sp. JEL0407]|nr:N-alpha-acetyltransferase 50 [Nowakowskiella sp. JEL0407]
MDSHSDAPSTPPHATRSPPFPPRTRSLRAPSQHSLYSPFFDKASSPKNWPVFSAYSQKQLHQLATRPTNHFPSLPRNIPVVKASQIPPKIFRSLDPTIPRKLNTVSIPHAHLLALELHSITQYNLDKFKALNLLLFPIQYSETFYRDVLNTHSEDLSCLVYHNHQYIGAISCRKEVLDTKSTNKPHRVYIMTLGVLEPFRNFGLGSKMLEFIIKNVQRDPLVDYIGLHVQITNYDAIHFYQKNGFTVVEKVQDYYAHTKDVDPPDAYLLKREI